MRKVNKNLAIIFYAFIEALKMCYSVASASPTSSDFYRSVPKLRLLFLANEVSVNVVY